MEKDSMARLVRMDWISGEVVDLHGWARLLKAWTGPGLGCLQTTHLTPVYSTTINQAFLANSLKEFLVWSCDILLRK